jgi:hypothetical protein
MKIYFDKEGSVAGLEKALAAAIKEGAGGLVVLACAENGFTPAALDPLLRAAAVPLIGGLFPAVMHAGATFAKGSVVLGFDKLTAGTITGLSSKGTDIAARLEELAAKADGARTMAVFVDPFTPRMPQFIAGLFDVFGLTINYIGGGAGALDGAHRPALICNQGMLTDAAVLGMVDTPSGVGVAHGWVPVGEPMQATSARGNLLKAIDFRPAFDVYAEAVAKAAGLRVTMDNFMEVSRAHPFGIARINGEMIVRDLLAAAPDGSFACAGSIPEDSFISIMNGDEASLLEAAGAAGRMALKALGGRAPGSLLLMDCISRRLFLGAAFAKETAVMAPAATPSAGACTIGEIANSGTEYLEFYNKTAVVAAMGDK